MKKVILGIIIFFFGIIYVDASSISNVDMNIHIDNNGNATVTEIRDCEVTQGTEGWHPFYNLGSSKITVKAASMDGRPYTIVDTWNENASVREKAYKAGIYKPNHDEVDVVFGVSEYGNHTYSVTYEITNFVVRLNDADMTYWNLFPNEFSPSPGNVTIVIEGYEPFSNDTPVWGFGMYGAPCYVQDGKIIMSTNGKTISSSEYLTILIKYNKGLFNTSTEINKNFNYYLNMAQEDSVPYKKFDLAEKINSIPSYIIIGVLKLCGFLIGFIIFYYVMREYINNSKEREFKKYNDQFVFVNNNKENILPFRDIPCKGDIFETFFIENLFRNRFEIRFGKVTSFEAENNNLIGALFLKWFLEKVAILKIVNDPEKKDNIIYQVVFLKPPESKYPCEVDIYNYLIEASANGVLEVNELSNWIVDNDNKLYIWYINVLDKVNEFLIGSDDIIFKVGTTPRYRQEYHYYEVGSRVCEENTHIEGLKKFFKEFTQIDSKEPIEVKLWTYYLIYAQIFGVAKEVAERFKTLYPDFVIADSAVNSSLTIFDNFYDNLLTSVDDHRRVRLQELRELERQNRRETFFSGGGDYSSGGGGHSSGGGGGGSFGGGGGGGGFR